MQNSSVQKSLGGLINPYQKFNNFSVVKYQKKAPNVIKVTELGQQAIANREYFGNFNDIGNRSFYNIKRVNRNTNEECSRSQMNCTTSNWKKSRLDESKTKITQSFSKKTLKAHQQWEHSHQRINSKIVKELENRQGKKSEDYQWNKKVSTYKNGISEIINNWNSSHFQMQNRVKKRLKQIYQEKYEKVSNRAHSDYSNVRNRYQKQNNKKGSYRDGQFR